jgi:hypothetical protein
MNLGRILCKLGVHLVNVQKEAVAGAVRGISNLSSTPREMPVSTKWVQCYCGKKRMVKGLTVLVGDLAPYEQITLQ